MANWAIRMLVSKRCLLFLSGAALGFAQVNQTEFFETRVRPVLANNCYSCHTSSKLGGLQVDSRAALLQGGKSGPAIVPGKSPDSSLLIKAVKQTNPRLKMPISGPKLKDEEIADLAQWIEAGAPWPESKVLHTVAAADKRFVLTPEKRKFWSFQPLQTPAIPSVKSPWLVKNPIDNFILAKLDEAGLKPLKPADKRVLLRRASYDLIGLPPTSEEIEAFERDSSPDAFAKVVDRLLASPHYGERWARHWLDAARYADGENEGGPPPEASKQPAGASKIKTNAKGARGMTFIGYGMTRDGFANTWRYRDWTIDAFNQDMPYDVFVKAQIAADLLPDKEQSKKLLPGLGLFGVGPWFTNDCVVFNESRAEERDTRVDVLTKGFLGLTVTCARCHDHKYDPISQKDYYSLAGIFNSSGYREYNLAPDDLVAKSRGDQAIIRAKQSEIGEFIDLSAIDVAERVARQTARYMMAGRKVLLSKPKLDAAAVAAEEKLHLPTFQRWIKYLGAKEREHPYLQEWDALMAQKGTDEEAQRLAGQFQKLVLAIIVEKRGIELANRDLRNNYKPDPNELSVLLPGDLMQFELFQFKHNLIEKVIDPKKYYVWMDVVQGPPVSRVDDYGKRSGILEYKGDTLIEFFTPEENAKLESLESELETLRKKAPRDYPYVMGLADNLKPANMKLNIRGNPGNLGEEVPRGFPAVLAGTGGDPLPFTKGSGRLELADAIAGHPLTARVMANRIWMEHFGRGIVATTTNLGMMGDRPTHPELLEYLASRLTGSHWSMKALHREIMLSGTYQLGYGNAEPNAAVDQDNRLLWRANLRRLDAEQLRDSLLFVAGTLDERLGGPSQSLNLPNNKKRTVYSTIARSGPNRLLGLFDFPDPNISVDQRGDTNVPLQGLFFINSDLIWNHAGLLAGRLGSPLGSNEENELGKIEKAYRLALGRRPSKAEAEDASRFLAAAEKDTGGRKYAWQQFAQALISSGEFNYIN